MIGRCSSAWGYTVFEKIKAIAATKTKKKSFKASAQNYYSIEEKSPFLCDNVAKATKPPITSPVIGLAVDV